MLFELLVGFALMAIAVMTIFLLFPSSDRAVMRAARINQAGEIARGLLEEELSQHYTLLALGIREGEVVSHELVRNSQTLTTQYLYRVDVHQPDPALAVKEVKVEVYWLEGQDERRHGTVLQGSKGEFW